MENSLNTIFNLKENDNGDIAVSGRELHKGLEINTRYDKWIARMLEYEFEENMDYIVEDISVPNSKGGKQSKINHTLTIDTAKEISMLQRNQLGKKVRKYFISIENSYQEYIKKEYQELQEKNNYLEGELNQLQDRIIYLESRQDNENMIDSVKWKEEAMTILRGIGKKRAYTEKNISQCTSWTISESYKLLNSKAKTNIKSKHTRYKSRLMNQGKSKTEVDKISIIDFISQDQNLVARYTEVIEQLAYQYDFIINQDKTEFNKFTLRLEDKNKNVLPFRSFSEFKSYE